MARCMSQTPTKRSTFFENTPHTVFSNFMHHSKHVQLTFLVRIGESLTSTISKAEHIPPAICHPIVYRKLERDHKRGIVGRYISHL
jgi:hypothetical protein